MTTDKKIQIRSVVLYNFPSKEEIRRAVASSTAIETGQSIEELEKRLNDLDKDSE